LSTLGWYDTYLRRICTERNWHHENSEQTALSLPYPDDFKEWHGINGHTIAVAMDMQQWSNRIFHKVLLV
jgi:hypothetical protein